jgi:hypothetical protein
MPGHPGVRAAIVLVLICLAPQALAVDRATISLNGEALIGYRIEIELVGGTTLARRFVGTAPNALVVRDRAGRKETISIERVQRIWRLENGTGKGVVTGLLLGSLGAFLVVHPGECGSCPPRRLGLATTIWTGGGIVGGLIGRRRSTRVLVYQSPGRQ